MRNLADEYDFAVLLIGTELYSAQYNGRSRHLLEQLGRRIGAKSVTFINMDKAATYLYIIKPCFGSVGGKIISYFWLNCRRGNWGHATELASACERVMKTNNLTTLNDAVIATAVKAYAKGVL